MGCNAGETGEARDIVEYEKYRTGDM